MSLVCLLSCDIAIFVSIVYGDFQVEFFFFKQKTAYEMRISDWSSDVCSSDLVASESGSVVVVFQERSMADKIDRQLTHRAAARSVTGLASMLADRKSVV